MGSFIDNESRKRVFLNDKEWVEIRAELSVKEIIPFSQLNNQANADYGMLIEAISKLVLDWNVYNSHGELVPFNQSKVSSLSVNAFMKMQQAIIGVLPDANSLQKKNHTGGELLNITPSTNQTDTKN